MSAELGMCEHTEPCLPAEGLSNMSCDTETRDPVPQGPEDIYHSSDPFTPADLTSESDQLGRTENDFCEFQYIEIVPLDSPKQAENNDANYPDEIKEEIKEEPDDVRYIISVKLTNCLHTISTNV